MLVKYLLNFLTVGFTPMTDFQQRRTTMVDTQVRPSDVTKFPIIDAMLKVRREEFVPDDKREAAYADAMIEVGEGRCVLEPRTFAKLLDAVDIQRGDMVLDLGCGMGYSSAIIGKFAEAVIAIEDSEAMVQSAESRLAAEDVLNVAVLQGELADGAAKHAPFDVIVIEGAVQAIPTSLTDQLAEGGRIATIFAEAGNGVLRVGYKKNGQISWRFACNASAPILSGFEKDKVFAL